MILKALTKSLALTILLFLFSGINLNSVAQEAEWIWHPSYKKDNVPNVTTYYRKMFNISGVEEGVIEIAADDQYTLFLNTKKIGSGSGTDVLDRYDITKFLKKGKNLVAIKVENTSGNTAALAARVQVKEPASPWKSFSTDRSWKVGTNPLPIWKFQFFNDSKWLAAKSFGKLGSTKPWDKVPDVKQQPISPEGKRLPNDLEPEETEFSVVEVIPDKEIGSVIAFEFNEFGKIIASIEKGGLVIIDPKQSDPTKRIRVLTDEVTAIQGILPLNGDIYVTGIYKNRHGLFLLKDEGVDETIDEIVELFPFKGFPGEHSAHGVTLGYDGKIYVSAGNHVSYDGPVNENSPYRNFYEGSIVKRYEDPAGHAKDIRVPGGTIIRCELDGGNVEIFSGGIRNAYDLAFNRFGDLFTYDSDMETDLGLSWYRPTRIYQVSPGAELGWRSGWAKWPKYNMDVIPPIEETGRGSPTGVCFYDHIMYPLRYKGTMFVADWSGGKIYNIQLKQEGGTYKVKKEIFVEGSPLNVTDLSVGPDGHLYFATGGRFTSGGIFKVKWNGKVPEAFAKLGDDVSRIIRQPQPQSAFGRQKLAELKTNLGTKWDQTIIGVALSSQNPVDYRIHAINLIQLFGPLPSPELLIKISKDKNEIVRGKSAKLLALDLSEPCVKRLKELLKDENGFVQRSVCEVLYEQKIKPDYDALKPLLVSDDRFVAYAARRVLETLPLDDYRASVLKTKDKREFVRGSLAMMISNPSEANAYAVLARVSELLEGYISDRNFIEMLRLVQVTIEVGDVKSERIPAFAKRIADEFPSGNEIMNLELSKILANLQTDGIQERLVEYLNSSKVSDKEKLEIAMHIQLISGTWSTKQKLALIEFMEKQIDEEKDGNYSAFIRVIVREFARDLTPEEAVLVLKRAKELPNAAFSGFYKLPKEFKKGLVTEIIEVDKSIRDEESETFEFIKRGIVAVLAQKGGKQGIEYLKTIWRRDPERRKDVALALTLKPESGSWPYLIASINESDDATTEVFRALKKIRQKPREAKYYRMVIVKSLELNTVGKIAAMDLLEFWTGTPTKSRFPVEKGIQSWQKWFEAKYPDETPAELSAVTQEQKWSVSLVAEVLKSDKAKKGSKDRGRKIFKSAQCANCHRYQNLGDAIGPDLTTISRRFTTREIIDAIIHPSNVVSDQYRSELIATADGRQLTGITAPGPNDTVAVLMSNGKKTYLASDEIEARKPSKNSIMPASLLEELNEKQIIDLFTFMGLMDEDRVAEKQRFRTR